MENSPSTTWLTVFQALIASTIVARVIFTKRQSIRVMYTVFFLLITTLVASECQAASSALWFKGLSVVSSGALGIFVALELLSSLTGQKASLKKSLKQMRKNRGPLASIVKSCFRLSKLKRGALIIIENGDPLESYLSSGAKMDSAPIPELVTAIFFDKGPLHDGALIIQNGRITHAGVVLPLTVSEYLPIELGTRHRAGIGISEQTDALSIIVSEETGNISIAFKGLLYWNVPANNLASMIEAVFKDKKINHPHIFGRKKPHCVCEETGEMFKARNRKLALSRQ